MRDVRTAGSPSLNRCGAVCGRRPGASIPQAGEAGDAIATVIADLVTMNEPSIQLRKQRSKKHGSKKAGCLSCGTVNNMGTRRFCSTECRQKLRRHLDLRTGLLKVLNTEYATFSFTDSQVTLNILPYGTKEIFTFFYPRSPGKTLVEDFNAMSEMLGSKWWEVKKKTSKHYIASHRLLDSAHRNNVPIDSVKPSVKRIPFVRGRSLVLLELTKSEINSLNSKLMIKRAYRRQAKIHHPDLGGNAREFRKIRQAYEELLRWADNPRFTRRQGFPDKWFYHAPRDRWLQPVRYGEWSRR